MARGGKSDMPRIGVAEPIRCFRALPPAQIWASLYIYLTSPGWLSVVYLS